jgi:DNA-binding NarL/FixJ family response regulator
MAMNDGVDVRPDTGCSASENRQGGTVRFDDGPAASNGKAPGSISVMLASNRRLMTAGLAHRLAREPGMALEIESFPDPARLGLRVQHRRPRILLLDKALLDRLDVLSLRAMRADFERTRVLLLWDQLCNSVVIDVLRHRFHGFLPTTCLPEVCLKAIHVVNRGELWLPRAAMAKALADLLPPAGTGAGSPPPTARGDELHGLTPREQQIVDLLRRGCTNKEIANELGVMEDTVKKHLQSVFGKLGVHRRALVALQPQLSAPPLS